MINKLKCKKLIKIIVKPNSNKNELVGFDKQKEAYVVRVKAKAEKNKDNIVVVKFFSKLLGKRVEIVKGLKSREKILRFIQHKQQN